jgi:hypothetical protein
MADLILKLRQSAKDQTCVACGSREGVVLAHYTGARRLAFNGGLGCKVDDIVGAHLCYDDHRRMDTESRLKSLKWEHSEEFLFYCARTWIRWIEQGVLK